MDKWLNDIRDRLKDYGQEPPQGLWEQLSTRLEQEGLAGKRQHKPAAWMLWPKRIAVAACIAVAVLVGYRYMPDFTQAPELASVGNGASTDRASRTIEQPGQTVPEAGSHQSLIAQNDNTGTAGSAAGANRPIAAKTPAGAARSTRMAEAEGRQSVPASVRSYHMAHAEKSATASAVADSRVADAVEPNETAKKPATPEPAAASARMGRSARQGSSRTMQARTAHASSSSPRLALSAHASGLTGSAMSAKGMSGLPTVSLGPDDASWLDRPAMGVVVFNQGKVVEHKVHHRLPVRVGASVSYDLNSRLALGSGLTYTRLRSDLREGTAANYQKSVQNLHYVGLPVNLKYTFLRAKNLSLYAQAGALAEVRVAGKRTTQYTLDHQRSGEETERIGSHPLQMSVNLAAGAQYNITPTLALYAEPGVSHHFKDNSSVPTIYEDKPTNFSLNVGVRLCLGR